MQRIHDVTGSQLKDIRLKKEEFVCLNLKNILLTSLLISTSNVYSCDLDCDLIELDDFQEAKPCEPQNNEIEMIEEELIKYWKKAYVKQGDQFIDNEYN